MKKSVTPRRPLAGQETAAPLLAGARLQTKLRVGEPGDPHEREADRVADALTREPVHAAGESTPHRVASVPGAAPAHGVSEEVASQLDALDGQGSSLAASARARFEPRLGHDFNKVRIHTDARAAELAQALRARAFTWGTHIVFARSQYAPGTREGQRLLAHELTHVVQQQGGTSPDRSGGGRPGAGASPGWIQRDAQVDESHEAAAKALDLAGYPGDLAPNAGKLAAGATKLYTVAKQIKEQGTTLVFFSDGSLMNAAQSVIDTAKAIAEVGTAFTSLATGEKGQAVHEVFGKASELTANASRVVSAANLLGSLFDETKTTEFLKDPHDPDKAAAWAEHVGKTFSKAATLIDAVPDGLLPGFVVAYYKGLFTAPANYIAAFRAIMKSRYDKIDAETGGNKANMKAVEGEKTVWEGPLSGTFIGAQYVTPPGLQDYMKSHQTIGKLDLYETPLSVGKALLVGAIQGDKLEPKTKEAWIKYLDPNG